MMEQMRKTRADRMRELAELLNELYTANTVKNGKQEVGK